jgi:hypothetical protein
MKRLLFALFIAASIVTGSVYAQGSSPDCDPDAVVTSFADAVIEDTLDFWIRDYVSSDCEISVLLAVIDLANAYTSMDDTADSGVVAQWASGASATSEYGSDSYSAMQATGAPNTAVCGDSTTAWASQTSTEEAELTLTFDELVIPAVINIHQNYTPGSIIQVSLIDAETGDIIPITDSADSNKTTPCPRVFMVTPVYDQAVSGVVISFDQSIGGSWNEIDAVELIGVSPG